MENFFIFPANFNTVSCLKTHLGLGVIRISERSKTEIDVDSLGAQMLGICAQTCKMLLVRVSEERLANIILWLSSYRIYIKPGILWALRWSSSIRKPLVEHLLWIRQWQALSDLPGILGITELTVQRVSSIETVTVQGQGHPSEVR